MSSVYPSNIEVKRTRSGRAVIPPLAGWTGERIVSSLDDEAPLQYVSPTLDSKAQYLLSSNMLERFKKQKLIEEPFKVEEQGFSMAVVSDHSRKSACQPKQKSLETGHRKSVVHRTEKGGLTGTETLMKKKAVYRMHTQHKDDDKSDGNADVILQFERYAVDESESDESSKSRGKSPPLFEYSPLHDGKAVCSKKHSRSKNIRRNELDTYLLDQDQIRLKKRLEQKSAFKDSRTIQRKDDCRSGKACKDNAFIITELQKDEYDDFRIRKEDMEHYYLTDEDSDTVYTNY